MSEIYVTRQARKDEVAKVIDYFKEHHMKEDVIDQAFKKRNANIVLTPAEQQALKVSVETFMSRYPIQLVVQGDEQIVAAVVLYPAEDDLKKTDLPGRSDELDNAIIELYVNSGLYEQLNNTRMLKLRKLSVHREHRGKGLAKKVIEASVDWAKVNGYDLVFSLFSTPAAKKAAEAVGFVKFLDYDVRQLKDSKGQPLLADCSPNNIIALMTKKVK